MQVGAAEAIVRCLEAEDVRHVYGIASGKLNPLMRALSGANSVRFTGVRHEGAAALMAAGSAAGTGRIAVALGELGPGSGNLVSGVASAFSNNLPMLVLTSANPLHASRPSRGMLMELDLVSLFQPITKRSEAVLDGRRIPEQMHAAFREALSGRPGPVHLNIPADILAGAFPYRDAAFAPPASYRAVQPMSPAPDLLDEAAGLLSSARRPLIVAGGGAVAAGAGEAATALAERLGAALVPTQMGIGTLPSNHPNFIGHGGIIGGPALLRAVTEADAVLLLGCRVSSWFWGAEGPLFARDAKIVQVDTDPGQVGRIVPVACGIVADARRTAQGLLAALDGVPPQGDWLASLVKDYAGYRGRLAALAASGTAQGAPHPARLTLATDAVLPPDALVTYDGGHTTFWNNDLISAPAPRTRFHDPGVAQLGFGLPYAIALQQVHPDRCVVNITGDGSFGFTIQELDTARRAGLPVINVIHNNEAWGVIRLGQEKAGFEFATGLAGTDYAAIARGFGCHGERVADPDDFAGSFERALGSGLPAVLDCRVAFEPHPSMPLFAGMAKPPAADMPLPA